MDRRPPRVSGEPPLGTPLRPRRSERLAVGKTTQLRSEHRYQVEVKVNDVSSFGFKAECPTPVQIGSYVSLDVPGIGPVHAQVRWQLGVTMGGMFLEPISLVRCEWTAVKIPGESA
jgi:hypothetical protein